MNRTSPHRRNERGAAFAEAAIVLPFLILIAFGVADLGRAVTARIELYDAAQEGSLYASVDPSDNTAIRNAVRAAVPDLTLPDADIQVTCPGGRRIAIEVERDMPMVTFVGKWFGSEITLTAEAEGVIYGSGTCTPT